MKVMLHFPNVGRTVEMPDLPRQGETLYWKSGKFSVTDVVWDTGPDKETVVTVELDPVDMEARRVVEAEGQAPPVSTPPAPEKRGLSDDEAAALIEREPELAALGIGWVRNLSKFNFRTFQMLNLVRQVRSGTPAGSDAPDGS